MVIPDLKSTVGKKVNCNNPDGSKTTWKVIDEVRTFETNFNKKVLILQKLERIDKNQSYMYRFGYYIIGVKQSRAGKWLWGQFSPFIDEVDFIILLNKAKQKGWFKIK